MAYQEHLNAATQKAASAANDVVDSAAHTADRLQAGAASIQRDVASRAADLTEQAATAVKKLGVDPAELKSTMDDAWEALEQRFRDLVRGRPIRAVMVSAAVGVLLGFMSRG